MATFNKFNSAAEDLMEAFNGQSDTFKVMLTNTLPVAANAVKTDIVEIAAGNGYTAGGNAATLTSSSQAAGLYKLILVSPAQWVCVTAAMATFRYVVLYDDTVASPVKPLLGWWDYGSAVTLGVGETFDATFSAATGIIQLS
jgi:hypothetical protein